MRLFAAVFPTEDTLHRLEQLQRELMARISAPCSWTRREKMHLTLRFFGDDADPWDATGAVERAVRTAAACDLKMDMCSGFPNPRRARVLFAGASEPDERVMRLSQSLNPLERDPVPHLTLGRPRRPVSVPEVEFEPIPMELSTVALVHSILSGPEAGYQVLETWALPR